MTADVHLVVNNLETSADGLDWELSLSVCPAWTKLYVHPHPYNCSSVAVLRSCVCTANAHGGGRERDIKDELGSFMIKWKYIGFLYLLLKLS